MGKKRERPFESASKRRTKLQIDSAASTRKDGIGTGAFGSTFQEALRPQSELNPLSGLLGQYGDSDDEDIQDNEPGTTGEAVKPKNEIDAKVADFLAEIDALDGVESPVPSGETSEVLSKDPTDDTTPSYIQQDPAPNQVVESTSDVTSTPDGLVDAEHVVADSTNGEAADLGEWQELLDEATNCVYYWNTVTSEVTWEMPEVLKLANQQLAGQSYDHQTANGVSAQDSEMANPVAASGDVAVARQQGDELNEEDSRENFPESDSRDEGDESRKLPVYGPGTVEYDLSPEPEIEEEEFELQKPEAKKPAYSMFVKEDVIPGSENGAEATSDESSSAIGQDKAVPVEEAEESTSGEGGETRFDSLEDDMDIDEQLERALERRKAELQQLESEGMISPCLSEKKRKASEPVELYDDNGEVILLAIKKKRIENLCGSNRPSGETRDKGTQCDDELQDIVTKKKSKEADTKKEIVEMASTLDSKLSFLGITGKDLTKFHIMLVEKEVRVRDWRDGFLESKHLLRHLRSADWEFQRYELEAAPPGWSCNWDREHKQYYYTDSQTGVSQWDYPAGAGPQEEEQEAAREPTEAETESRYLFNQASLTEGTEHGNYVQDVASVVSPPQEAASSPAYNTLLATTSSITEPSSVDYTIYPAPNVAPTPPVPAPSSPPLPAPVPPPSLTSSQSNPPLPSKVKPPPPPPGTELFPPLPDSPPPPLPSGLGPELPPLPLSPPPPPPPPDDDVGGACDSTRAMTPPHLPLPHLPSEMMPALPGDLPTSTSVASSSAVIGKPQVLYSAPASSISSGPTIVAEAGYTAPVMYSAPSASVSNPSLPGTSTTGAQQSTKTKKKKEKTKSKTASKKNKLPLSLVQKWQQIKEEVEREEIANEEEEDEDEDPNVVTQKRIEVWKKEQMAVGVSTKNANFEMIQGDWRERLKKKSSQNP